MTGPVTSSPSPETPSPLRELREGRGTGPAYYNEHDPYAAQWLRNLMEAGHIAPGYVDERSIVDVRPADLAGFAQCHFFAGIGGWSYAARLAGWPDDRPLWTGSCPCQPFSVAGAGKAQADDRHLWPVFFDLIRACRPDVVMGEQVAAAVGKDWLDGVHSDLEGIGYACGASVVPACAVDAPHRRDRLWFVANGAVREQWRVREPSTSTRPGELQVRGHGSLVRRSLAQPEHGGRERRHSFWRGPGAALPSGEGAWLAGADGKARRVEPGIRLLAHGVPARVGKLRAYGNAIVPQVAAEVIGAYLDQERAAA